jgi:hypothetical protein
MISQTTKSSIKSAMAATLAAAQIKATFGVNNDTMILKIKSSTINFIENYNSNYRGGHKVSHIMSIEAFNRQWFSGAAKEIVSKLFAIAKSYGCGLVIEVTDR